MAALQNKYVDINDKSKSKRDFLYDLQPGDKDLLRPVLYHNANPGKHMLTKLIQVMNFWLEVPEDKLAAICEILDNLHNITLAIDDIQDGSLLRRGRPAAYTVFGIDNTANACLFHGLGIYDAIERLNHPQALRLFLNAYLDLFSGQGMELYWRDNGICPTEEEYEKMIVKKTGPIALLAGSYLHLFSKKRVEVHKLISYIVMYYQIRNDYASLHTDPFFPEQGFLEDITEGKFGHPMMHAINNYPEAGKEIIKILKMRTTDAETKKHCWSLIEKCGSFQYTLDRLKSIKAILIAEIGKLEDNPLLMQYLSKLIEK